MIPRPPAPRNSKLARGQLWVKSGRGAVSAQMSALPESGHLADIGRLSPRCNIGDCGRSRNGRLKRRRIAAGGNTLRTDAQSVQRLDQAKFQIKAVATKRIIFFGTNSEKGRPRFHSAGPERRSRWSPVGWSMGTRMVAVDVAIARRGPRDVADGDDTRIVARLLRTDFDHAGSPSASVRRLCDVCQKSRDQAHPMVRGFQWIAVIQSLLDDLGPAAPRPANPSLC